MHRNTGSAGKSRTLVSIYLSVFSTNALSCANVIANLLLDYEIKHRFRARIRAYMAAILEEGVGGFSAICIKSA